MRKLLEKFFQHYLTERNLEATLAVLTEDVVSVGTGEQEISRNKGELRELLLSEFEELPNALEYEICDYMQNFSGGGSICTQLAVFNIRLKAENEITEIHSRLTSTCVKDGNEWKIASRICLPQNMTGKRCILSALLRKKCSRNIVEGIRRKTYGTCDKCTSGRYYGWISGRRLSTVYHQ